MEETEKDVQKEAVLPFDNLFLNSGYVSGFNDWWMYGIGIAFTILCYICAPVITSFHLLVIAEHHGVTVEQLKEDPNKLFDYRVIGADRNLVLLALLGIFVVAFIGFYFAIRKFHRKSLLSVLTGYEKFRFARFWFAFAVWGVLLACSTIIDYLTDPGNFTIAFDPQGLILSVIMMFLLMPFQTGLEEMFFRGYLLQGLSQVFKNGLLPLLITSLLFAAAHMSNPEVKEFGWLIMFTYYLLFAIFMGCLTLLDEGLELAFGIHFANNLVNSVMVSSSASVLKTYSVFESKTDNPVREIIVWFLLAMITFVIFWLRYRWKNFKLIIR